ncbi:hypothetical protein NDU88_000789 [Pleurodeles waltl]|uniref:Uncharacterized protein n=1 Tax=Pleurodeles waltl TaxID=8319 RepID=A0AAV7RB12_PLEWA|nr:hypothetical protein NDU88_000789 [Pleurodeles waltl]
MGTVFICRLQRSRALAYLVKWERKGTVALCDRSTIFSPIWYKEQALAPNYCMRHLNVAVIGIRHVPTEEETLTPFGRHIRLQRTKKGHARRGQQTADVYGFLSLGAQRLPKEVDFIFKKLDGLAMKIKRGLPVVSRQTILYDYLPRTAHLGSTSFVNSVDEG